MDVYGAPPGGLTGDYYGGHPFGVLAEDLPAEGLNGGSYLRDCVSLPADAGKRVRGPITRWPAAPLTVHPDGAFDYPEGAAADYALYRLYVQGTASITDIGYGAGIGRINLNVGLEATLSGNVQLDDAAASGHLQGATTLGGNVQLDDAVAGGVLMGVAKPVLASRSSGGSRRPQISGPGRPRQ